MCLVLHEVAESTVDRSRRDGHCWNTTSEDDLYLTIVLYGLVDEISVLRVILDVGKVDIVLHHDGSCLLHPAHILKPFELEDMNSPCSSMSQMVVDLRWVNFTPIELENSVRNNFNFLQPESLIHLGPHS